MFGRDLTDQVRSDSKVEERTVPVIVEKCIEAVDALGKVPCSLTWIQVDLSFSVGL
jgi:hypothetical protein